MRSIPNELTKRPFTLAEARVAGLTRKQLAGKSWRHLGRGLYCWSKLPEDPWGLLVAWARLLPPEAAYAGFTAAWLHGLAVDPIHPVEVAVPPRGFVRSRRNLVIRHLDLPIADLTVVRALRVTSSSRTMFDLRTRLPRPEFLVLADAALRLGLGRFDELAAPAESPMETRLRWLLVNDGLPRPEVQVDVHNMSGRFVGRADLYYPTARLVIEYDGINHRDRLVEDNRRQNLLLDAAFRLLRFTAADLMQRPDSVAALVRGAFARPPHTPPAASRQPLRRPPRAPAA